MSKLQKTINTIRRKSFKQKHKVEISKPYNLKIADVTKYNVSIMDCPFDFNGYGPLILTGVFNNKTITAFMFETILIFTTVPQSESECYYYKDSIKMTDLGFEPVKEKKPRNLYIKNYASSEKCGKNIIYKLKADTKEMRDIWKQEIEKGLWNQFNDIRSKKSKSGRISLNCSKSPL